MVDSMLQKSGRNIHEPIETLDQDLLGRHMLAETILKRLASEDVGVLGIYGGWGTGKSSLLSLIRRLNEQRSRECRREELHIEIIDAWKYEASGNLLIPVIVRLKKLAGNIALKASWQRIARRVLSTTMLTLVDAGLKKVSALDRENIKENFQLVQQHEKENNHSSILLEWQRWSDDVERTEKAFQAIISSILKHHDYSRLVLCIDNLDRCSPEAAISLLESVKNFLTVPGCVWVFAVDSDVIASYIDKKYEGTAVNGHSFLDKIVPEQYHLSLSPSVEDREIILNLIYSATDSRLTLDNPSRLPQVPRAIVPRRLIKSAQKFFEFFEKTPFDSSHDTVFALILLYHSWPDFYELLSSPSANHIGCLLANFFRDKEKTWDGYEPLPLNERFKANQELMYFLRQSFPTYRDVSPLNHSSLVNEIRLAMDGLRRTGLP